MALVRSPARIARAIDLRNVAVDLVALRGRIAEAQDRHRTVRVMMFEGDRLSILYKTPTTILGDEGAPAEFRPRDFMLDAWFDGRKTLSVHWNHDGPAEVVGFKPGEWEDVMIRSLADVANP